MDPYDTVINDHLRVVSAELDLLDLALLEAWTRETLESVDELEIIWIRAPA